MNKEQLAAYEKAGKIAHETVAHARGFVKKGMSLLDLANEIESHIEKLGGAPAFPVNLSINEIAAHATPSYDETGVAHGLLKIDLGVHIDGAIADTSFSVDLENSDINKKLIEAAQAGLAAGITLVKKGARIGSIGGAIDQEVKKHGVTVVRNLCGHSIEEYDVHAGTSIPNHDDGSPAALDEGVFAIEPFTTTGRGSVRDGRPSGIYQLVADKPIRDPLAREILMLIAETNRSLPFASRWIHAHFGMRGLIALRQLEQAGILYQYPQLVEVSGAPVAQAEHTIIVLKDEIKVITKS